MAKKHAGKVPIFAAAPKQNAGSPKIQGTQSVKPATGQQSMKPRGTSAKSGQRGK